MKIFLNIYITVYTVGLNYFISNVNNQFILKVQLLSYRELIIFENIKNSSLLNFVYNCHRIKDGLKTT